MNHSRGVWWELLNYSCGERLGAIMPKLSAKLEGLQDRYNVAAT